MKQLTQTLEDNCWQTCVAMLLECSPELLPDQHHLSTGPEYANALRAYLYKHCDRIYVEFGLEHFARIAAQEDPYVMIGETVRMTPEHDVWHAVIGLKGKQLWDVHPSRAGLTKLCKVGVVTALNEAWRDGWGKMVAAGDPRTICACPSCAGSNEKREEDRDVQIA